MGFLWLVYPTIALLEEFKPGLTFFFTLVITIHVYSFLKVTPRAMVGRCPAVHCNTEAVVQKTVHNNFNIIITLLYVYTDVYERR